MNTLYRRSIVYYLIAIILGFSFLEIGLTEAFKNYFYIEKRQALLSQAVKISDIYSMYIENDDPYSLELKDELAVFDKYSDYSFFITDNDFNIKLKSIDIKSDPVKIYISNKNSDMLLAGKPIMSFDDFDGLYSNSRYYIAYPVKFNDQSRIIFVTSNLDDLNGSINKWYVISIIFIVIAAAIGFVVIYLTTARTLSGIIKLNNAAKLIADGNFNQRIETNEKDELYPIAKSFNHMAESLSEAEKNKQEFLSNIAHDIRSPITSINGFLNAILDGTIPKDETEHYLKVIKSETDRLSKMTNSILNFNNMSAKMVEISKIRFNINELILNTVESLSSRIYSKKLDIKYDFENEDIFVLADYEKIQRVLYNLYDNAIKFSNDSGAITTAVHKSKNKAVISVCNTGQGLTKEECKRVFDRLYKADSSRGIDKSGSGLGLAIAKEFINAHNETINVKSKQGKNTTFTFTLDLENKYHTDLN